MIYDYTIQQKSFQSVFFRIMNIYTIYLPRATQRNDAKTDVKNPVHKDYYV